MENSFLEAAHHTNTRKQMHKTPRQHQIAETSQPYPTLPYPALPSHYPTLPCSRHYPNLTLPYPNPYEKATLPYPTLPYPTLPYPTLTLTLTLTLTTKLNHCP